VLVVDSTMFSEDFLALEIRLHELNAVVDLFVICESNFSFSGKPKPYYLSENLNRYSEFLHKIQIVKYDLLAPNPNPWVQESLQRQFLSRKIQSLSLSPMDLIISSDCDEIPRSSIIRHLIGQDADHLLVLRNFTNYLNVECGQYRRGRVISAQRFVSIEKMRQDCYIFDNWGNRRSRLPVMRVPEWFTCRSKFHTIPELTFKKPRLSVVEDAGWHFNHLMRGSSLERKVMYSSHTDLATSANSSNIESSLASAQDVYHRQATTVVKIDSSFPQYVQNNVHQLQEFLFHGIA
jgi:beta-1,4-mannosyl-glycoprotein beta-1,4-N-acetylglucosaminyltransferase